MSTPRVSAFGGRKRRLVHDSPSPVPEAELCVDFDSLPEFQVIVKSFRRFECLKLMLDTLLKFYPDARLIIADDSYEDESELPALALEIKSHSSVEWISLPFNTGLAAGRAAALNAATAEVVVMVDDDYVFTSEARIENLLTVLACRPDIDLVAGSVRFDAITASSWNCGLHWAKGQPVTAIPLNTNWCISNGVRHRETDLALNWYAARRTSLLACPWDEQFKIVMEHIDHFMMMKEAGLKCHYTSDSVIGHEPRSPTGYANYRRQDIDQYRVAWLKKWGVTKRPGFAMYPEPNIPTLQPPKGRSVVVFGVGHSGTTIATRMVEALGFNAHNADSRYHENVYIRDLNDECLRDNVLRTGEARKELAYMEQAGEAWVIKDPRFIHTLDHWIPLLAQYEPMLLFVTRGQGATAQSYRRRGEGGDGVEIITRGVTLSEARRLAEAKFNQWPWAKLQVSLSQLGSAAAMFHQQRP